MFKKFLKVMLIIDEIDDNVCCGHYVKIVVDITNLGHCKIAVMSVNRNVNECSLITPSHY